MKLGEFFRRKRIEERLDAASMAELLGIAASTLHSLEDGSERVTETLTVGAFRRFLQEFNETPLRVFRVVEEGLKDLDLVQTLRRRAVEKELASSSCTESAKAVLRALEQHQDLDRTPLSGLLHAVAELDLSTEFALSKLGLPQASRGVKG